MAGATDCEPTGTSALDCPPARNIVDANDNVRSQFSRNGIWEPSLNRLKLKSGGASVGDHLYFCGPNIISESQHIAVQIGRTGDVIIKDSSRHANNWKPE
jgi:hypothetical protein